MSENDVIKLYYTLLKRLQVYKEDLISADNWQRAYQLCKEVDENDTPHVALTLELNGLLWTGDKKLLNGLRAKGFDSLFLK